MNRSLDKGGRVVIDQIFEAWREALAQAIQICDDLRSGLHGVGAGREIDADRHRRLAVEAAFDVLVLGAEVDPGDIAHAQQRAVGIGAQYDVAELLGCRQATLRLHVQLELLVSADRACADPAGRRLHVLRLDRRDHIGRRQLQIVEPLGVEPDAHRVIERAEQARLADPGCARQHVEHIDDHVIGNEQRILLAVLAIEHDELQDRRRLFLDRQPLQLDLGGELGQGGLHPVIDGVGVDVGIAAEHKADGEVVAAVIAARRTHVDHLVDADDLRLDRLGDAQFDDGGGGAGIGGRDYGLRRHDVRELRDRDAQQRQQRRRS